MVHQEVIQYSSLLGTLFGTATFVLSGEASAALPFAFAHVEVFYYSMGAAIMGYLSVGFVLLLIKHFSATLAEVVKSCRKIVSIMLSFMVHPKPFGQNHLLGGFLFFSSAALAVHAKKKAENAKANAASLPTTH